MKEPLEMIPCRACGELMPKLRKELYGYENCIICSDTEPYGCVHVVASKTEYSIQPLPLHQAKIVRKRTFY